MNTEKWRRKSLKNGIEVVTLYSWSDFPNYINRVMLDYQEYVWRGQRNESWPLESTLDRLDKKKKEKISRKEHLDSFKYSVRGRRGPNPPQLESENDWWALGQHYGLATPLLDWTHSPFVSLYFAFIDEGKPSTEYRAIYSLHTPTIIGMAEYLRVKEINRNNDKIKELEAQGKYSEAAVSESIKIEPQIEFVRPFSDENQRLISQNGVFVRLPAGQDLETWINNFFEDYMTDGTEDYSIGTTLLKLLIPNKNRNECLKALNRMNINHSTLFPDVHGASIFCNTCAEIDNY